MDNYTGHIIYVLISSFICVYVGKQCHVYGRRFICHIIHGDEHLADAINNLFLVGYYLINIGYIVFVLHDWQAHHSLDQSLVQSAHFISRILIILSAMHYLNLLGIIIYGRIIKQHANP